MSVKGGCCTSAIHSEGNAHDHAEWYAALIQSKKVVAAAIAWRINVGPAWIDLCLGADDQRDLTASRLYALIEAIDAYRAATRAEGTGESP